MRLRLLLFLAAFLAVSAWAAPSLPPSPTAYVTDSSGSLSAQTISSLNAKLQAFERETSNQVIVYVAPTVPGGFALEDFTQQAFRSWGVGQKEKNNGVVLFVFPKSHKVRIEVGYGLEGALPDARAKQIITNDITPAFKAGNFNGGVTRGVDAILQSIRGEYQGTGRTHQEETRGVSPSIPLSSHSGPGDDIASLFGFIPFLFPGFIVLIVILNIIKALTGGTSYSSRRRHDTWYYPGSSSGGGSFFGGSSGGSSSSDSGGGGFSGGGGDSGGGGASGSW